MLRTRQNGRLGQRKTDKEITLESGREPAQTDSGPSADHTSFPGTDDSTSYSNLRPDEARSTRKRNNNISAQLREWLSYRESYLRELLRHEGLGDYNENSKCTSCSVASGIFQCKDCFSRALLCKDCIVTGHRSTPLHRVQKWNGVYFERISLCELGLRIQLGHGGGPCLLPEAGPSEFIIVDLNGAHTVAIDYCDCSGTVLHKRTQLLRAQLLPATQDRPRTVFTFSLLKFFHELTLQGKTTIYDFYKTLMRRTDNAQISKMLCRYEEFHRAFRIWRHLQTLKRGGRGHSSQGASGTSIGELSVECPACPHPGRNLPPDWEKAPPTIKWLYTLFLAMDANFKLRLKKRGLIDTELAPGWSYYVDEAAYQKHLANYVDQPEINTCQSEHDAIARANTRHIPGHLVSGTGLVLCARHALIRKNGVADLTKGEKYCTMDYIALMTLVHSAVLHVIFSYDIACQWGKNLRSRVVDYPDALKAVTERTQWNALVPRWHIIAHGEDCQTEYSLNYEEGVGRTCGEDVECGWSHTNQLSTSTREMGPANRRETLDDHWGGWNWQKIIGFRALFRRRFEDAVSMRSTHRNVVARLTSTFPPKKIEEWSRMIEEWVLERKKPHNERKARNPYAEPAKVANLQDVKAELAKEEAEQALQGKLPLHDKIGPTEFLLLGLQLEDQQHALAIEAKSSRGKKTSKQVADLQLKQTTLQNCILRWRQAQLIYMPCVAYLLASDESSDAPMHPEELCLHLPSSLPVTLREQVPDLALKEERLRLAHADDALAEIRRHRRILSGLYQFKKLNVSGTGNRPNTRMYSLFQRFNNRIDHFASRYRSAYRALSSLNPSGAWRSRFQMLTPEDISGPGREDQNTSNGRFEPSWIWLVPRLPNAPLEPETEPQLEDSMRVDWAKAKARLTRWEEEVVLVEEEMRRVVMYLEWQAARWRSLGTHANSEDVAHRSGLVGYAERQADMYDQLVERSAFCWLPVLQKVGIEPEWGKRFVIPAEGEQTDVRDASSSRVTDMGEWVDQEEGNGDDVNEMGEDIADLEDFGFFDTEL